MAKSVNHIFYPKIKFRNMYEAYIRASKGKHANKEVILFEMNLASNLISILKELYYNKYKVGKYREFQVSIPKQRLIKALPFRDRVVHQWYVEEFIKPIFVPKFITDTYACIEGRGSHKAVYKLQKYMRIAKKSNPDYYILKCDVSKFFDSINKVVLLKILSKYIRDKDFIYFTKKILYENNDGNVGIPIGNYTSQFFANIYLNQLDHYVKEELHVKYYVRYMDDFIIIANSKAETKRLKEMIEKYLNEKLELKLNKKTNYFKNSQGVSFLRL